MRSATASRTRWSRLLPALCAVMSFLAAAGNAPARAAEPEPMDNATCLSCHGNEGFGVPRTDGTMRNLYVPPTKFESSKHGALSCVMCHENITEVPHKVDPKARVDCGKCHGDQKDAYLKSVHAEQVAKGNTRAPSCSSCHTQHEIQSPSDDKTQVMISRSCGGCHKENFRTYTDTYHGQVSTLGYAHTAQCFDCHGNHGIKRVSDPESTVHPDNRLKTCQKCHEGATAGFVSFQPHGNTHDFERFPYLWIASKGMIALLIGVFAFFWLHSALWFYREYRDRQAAGTRPHIVTATALPHGERHFQRFKPGWRLAHLLFALSVMTLVLTGMSVFYADAAWAKALVVAIGGPQVAALAHRVAAAVMLGIFFIHLIVLAVRLGQGGKPFDWFGPNSLVPRWQDLEQAVAMFRWFFGKGPRPSFDRWTYWEKFDYWAVFWGMAVIGGSGMMLAFPNAVAAVLPGWVFNIATIVHGEEAFLAAVFLFTVHFFNNHFRPDKYPPPDIVMFTGAVPLEHFRREHALEYQRLVESGELERHLVDAPSRPMTVGSRILGFVLIGIGLVLLGLVAAGFVGSLIGPH